MTRLALALALAATTLACACNLYSALDPSSYSDGLACSSAGTCPPGQACDQTSHCHATSSGAGALEAAPPDLGTDADPAAPDAR